MNRRAFIGVAGIRDAVLRDEDVIFEVPVAEHDGVTLRADGVVNVNTLDFMEHGRTPAVRAQVFDDVDTEAFVVAQDGRHFTGGFNDEGVHGEPDAARLAVWFEKKDAMRWLHSGKR